MYMLRLVVLLISPLLLFGQGSLRRCYVCRSRGEDGDCKDKFIEPPETIPGLPVPAHSVSVDKQPCSSGWCSKILDGGGKNQLDDLEVATERACMQRAPSDDKQRCAYVKMSNKEVFMCFCKGDLCNGSTRLSVALPLLAALLAFTFWLWYNFVLCMYMNKQIFHSVHLFLKTLFKF